MYRRQSFARWPNAFVAVALLTLFAVLGCDNRSRSLSGIGAGNLPPGKVADPCATHQAGCPCSNEGATTACGSVKQKSGDTVTCSVGERTCSSGQWGDCLETQEVKKPLSFRAPMQGGYTAQALGSGTSCTDDPCDPGCQDIKDTADGLTVDVDLAATPDGVTLPGSGGGGQSCNAVTLSPAMATVTVTGINTDGTITATPNNGKVDFDASCTGNVPLEPSWTIDSYDRAVISAHGVVTVYSGRGGPIQVTGATSGSTAVATLNVKVQVGDAQIPAGTTTEVGKTLYPYNGTLFPLGLTAPLVQWTEGGITPTKTQVLLCYPKDTCTIFQYAYTYPNTSTTKTEPRDGTLDNTVPAWQIPQAIWSAFDETAAGNTGQIIIRRQNGSTKYKQLSIDVNFATDALRGTVYYTQYQRALHTQSSVTGQTITYSGSTYAPGQICEVGNTTHPSGTQGSQTRAIDLSTWAASNTDPFAKGKYSAGCPVCHSVSADGSTAVSGGQNWQNSGAPSPLPAGYSNSLGVDKIGLDSTGAPMFTGLFSAPNYSNTSATETSGEDSRGFSYAAISPDGELVLQAPEFWGSTQGTPASNNTQNANIAGIGGGRKLYFFADTKTPNPGFAVQFATTGPLPAYTPSGTGNAIVLTGTGSLTLDGVGMSSTSYSVLVKDETGGNAKYNGVYTVSATSPWKLKIRSDAYASTAFKPNTEVRVTDGVANRGNVYYVSAPTSGTITPGSTAFSFSQRIYPPMLLGGTTHSADYATTTALSPATVTQSGNVLTAGAQGYLIQDGHTLALGETLLVKDQANGAQNGIYKMTTAGGAGSGTPTTASYATTTALPTNTNNAGVLTASANGPLPSIDGIAPAVGDTVLVKNEGTQANNGIYTVTVVGVTGSGTPLGAALYGTTAALPANTNTSGVLTGTGFGSLGTIDGVTPTVGDRVLVKNEATQANNGVFTVTALGAGGTVSHTSAKVATTAALPANTNAAGVLTATSWGPLPAIDGVTVVAGDRVLVKNETATANNGIYTVTNVGTGTSTVRTAVAYGTTAALPTNTNTSGTLTATNYGGLGTIDGVTVTAGDRLLVMNETTQANNGIYTVTNAGTGTSNAHAAVRVGTTAALPGYSASAGVLTGTAWGVLPVIDGVTVTAGDRVLVMNETTQANNGIYTVTNTGAGTNVVHTAVRVGTTASLPANIGTAGVLSAVNYGGLVVDGVTLVAGDRVLVKNEVTQANNGIYTVTDAGLGTGSAHVSARAATTGALPANTNASGVLTATAFGALPAIDGVTLALTDRVLVKDETAQANNGIYQVTSLGTGTGSAHTAVRATTTAALPANTLASGVLTETGWGSLGSIDGVAVVAGDRVLVKNEVSQASNGIYVVTNVGTGTTNTHTAVAAATTAGLPAYSASSGVLTATSLTPLGAIDGISVANGDRLLVKNETTQANNGIYVVTNRGTNTGTSHTAVKYATAMALTAYGVSGNVLTETGSGRLKIDGVNVALNDRVLVKNETATQYNGIYTVTATGGTSAQWSLTRATDADASGELNPGDYVSVTAGSTNTGLTFYLSTPTTGTITINSTGVGFSQSASWVLTRALDADATGELVVGDQVPVTGGTVNAGLGYYISSPASGTITINTTAIGFSQSVKWVLTRATDADATGEILVGDQVPVTSGTVNVGTTYYVSSPTSGVITVNTTAIGFSQSSKWVLTRVGDAASTGQLNVGDLVPVTSGTLSSGLTYYVSVPASGTITLNTTPIGFAVATKWVLTRATDAAATGQLNPGEQVPVTSGTVNAGTTYYVSSPASGTITINTTAIGFSQSSKWVLTRATDADATGELLAGDQVPVTSGTANGGKTFYVSTPASGTITINTTAVGFAVSVKWVLVRATDADATGELVGGDQVPVTGGTANGGKTFYVSTPASGGSITFNTTAIAFAASSKWILTRATDADATGELNVGDQVPVTSGTANGGKTFYVSTPASGTITINTTGIGFAQASKWSLTRATDANTSVQVFPGLQVPVTSGATNGGKTYYISSPASGTITLNTTNIVFSLETAWQLTRKSPYDAAGGGLVPGLQVTVSGGTTNGGKTYYISTPMSGTITVNTTAIAFGIGQAWQLTRTTDADTTGEITPGMEVSVANGASNAGRVFSVSSPTSGTITLNTTAIAFSYGLPSMMAPVISPDGSKIAYVNGDADVDGGFAETGWRRGLTMLSFDQSSMTLSSKKRLINNWSSSTTGTPVKWPFFEGDSRSLLYVETDPNEFCSFDANRGYCNSVPTDTAAGAVCTGTSAGQSVDTNLERACFNAAYGSMSPTTRGFWPGRIFSIDTAAANPASTRHELSALDDAEDPTDADKAYQPTVLPFTAGGKRWVIFTSPRAYGNQFNQKSTSGTPTDLSCAASMLWVSAVDNETATSTKDRSHPAFFMPGQQVLKITTSPHYVNERGYLVPSPCKSTGNSCSVDEECCGSSASPATAACRAPLGWDPSTGAPAKTCQSLSGTCSNSGESCSVSSDCCNGASCVNFECATGGHYTAATFTREYVASCPSGQLPSWTLYKYHLTTPSDSQLVFSAQTSDDLSTLDAATVVALGSSSGDTTSPTAPEQIDVGAALVAAKVSKNFTNLRILVKLVPSSDTFSAPILNDWEMRYSCQDQL